MIFIDNLINVLKNKFFRNINVKIGYLKEEMSIILPPSGDFYHQFIVQSKSKNYLEILRHYLIISKKNISESEYSSNKFI